MSDDAAAVVAPERAAAPAKQEQETDGPSPLKPQDPQVLGPYRLVGRLGAGGMGTVYAGIDSTERRAAVKLVHRELAHEPEFRLRFAREIALLGRVHGSFAVRVLGFDTEAAQPWLATEYVAGPTLAHRVTRSGPLSEQEVIGLSAGLAEALRAMHAAGVIHRDLKPSNVILSATGPRLIDMGIARALDETSVTRTGVLVGSPGWISPEEYRGEEVSPAADIYGWGLLSLFAATGRMAFGTGRPEVLAMRVLSDSPDTSDVPEQIQPLLRRALSKDPAERLSAEEILSSLSQAWRQPGEDSATATADVTQFLSRTWIMPLDDGPAWNVPPLPRRSRQFKPVTIAGAALAAGVVLAATVFALTQTHAGNSSSGSAPSVAGSTTAVAVSTSAASISTPSPSNSAKTATPSPTPTPTPSPGKRVKMVKGFSFVLPSDWMYFPDNTNNPDNMCLRPKARKDDDYFYCSQFGMGIFPWWSLDGTFGADLSWLDDPDDVSGANEEMAGCGYGQVLRKGKMLKSGLHKIGDRRAYYRKARSFCKDGRVIERETLVLPTTHLTVDIDKMSAKQRAQVEEILRSFKFPKKPV